MNDKPLRFKALIVCLICVLLGGLVAYTLRPRPKTHVFAFVNTSASARPQLAQYEAELADVYDQQTSTKSPFTCFRFDANLQEFNNGIALGDSDDVRESFHRQLAPKAGADNTYTNLAVRELERRVAKTCVPTVAIILTDGFSENMGRSGHRSIRRSAAALAKNPYLCGVVIEGARRQSWAEITADFDPLIRTLKERFIIRSDTDFQSSDALELIKSAPDATERRLKCSKLAP